MTALVVLEADAVIDAVITRLRADTGAGGVNTLVSGRIYRDATPTATPIYPIVQVFLLAAGPALQTADSTHVWLPVTTLVKVTDKGTNYGPTYTLAKRIIAQLDQYERFTQDAVYVEKLRYMESPPQSADYIDGARYMYFNATFFCEAAPA